MKNLSVDVHAHDEAADEELYSILKTAGEAPPGDNDKSTVGSNTRQYDNPEDRDKEKGTIDAFWGDRNTTSNVDPNSNIHFSKPVLEQFAQGREELLKRLFDSQGSSEQAAQAIISQSLEHGASGDYETSSPQLSKGTKPYEKTSSALPESLSDSTRRLLGRV